MMLPTFRAASRAAVPVAVPALVKPHSKVNVAAPVVVIQPIPLASYAPWLREWNSSGSIVSRSKIRACNIGRC